MKMGDLITTMWQHNQCYAVIGGGLRYVTSSGEVIGFNDLRCIWGILNQDVPVESSSKDGFSSATVTVDRRVKDK